MSSINEQVFQIVSARLGGYKNNFDQEIEAAKK